MNDDDLIGQVCHKIEREKALIHAANAMRQSSNPQVQHSLDAQIKEGRKNIGYLEGRLNELQMRRMGQGMDSMSIGSSNNGGPAPPPHGNLSPQQQNLHNNAFGPPNPPPKTGMPGYLPDQGGYGSVGQGGSMDQLGGGQGMVPPRPPYGPPAPGSGMPKARPNYSRLGEHFNAIVEEYLLTHNADLIKADTAYLGPRFQLMLSQLTFKLSVEKKYKDGIEKLVRLYSDDGDRKSRADAELRRIESNQKIQLLKRALKRYEDLHVDMEHSDANDGIL